MSNDDDDPDRTNRESTRSEPSGREETSLATALEASLQAGLRSLSEGLRNAVGDDARAPRGGHPRPRPSARRTGRTRNQRTDDSKRERAKLLREPVSERYLIDSRLTDDEFVVTADIPDANQDEISVGIDRGTNELVINVSNTVIGRVDLPWTAAETKRAWFNNGVLEVHMRSNDTEPSS
jgi:HSP20 family molecular chaperone IbpA